MAKQDKTGRLITVAEPHKEHRIKFNKDGRELPDGKPLELPSGMKKPESLKDLVARMVRQHNLVRVDSEGEETFDEANDFDIDEDDSAELFPTHHELHEEVIDATREVRKEKEQRKRDQEREDQTRETSREREEEEIPERPARSPARTNIPRARTSPARKRSDEDHEEEE